MVSKPQIRFKRTRARRRQIEKVVVLSIHAGLVCEHLSEVVLHPNLKIRCESRASGATQSRRRREPFEPFK
jgi:hypothetical protein